MRPHPLDPPPMPPTAHRLPRTARRALVAVLDGARTVRDVAAAIDRSPTVTFGHLRHLRALGLVAWAEGQHGSLHAAVCPVPLEAP